MLTILLLPAHVKHIRDAARSARRLGKRGAQRITAKTLDLIIIGSSQEPK